MPGRAEGHGARTGRAVVAAAAAKLTQARDRCQANEVLAAPGCSRLLAACALCPRAGDQTLFVSLGELCLSGGTSVLLSAPKPGLTRAGRGEEEQQVPAGPSGWCRGWCMACLGFLQWKSQGRSQVPATLHTPSPIF